MDFSAILTGVGDENGTLYQLKEGGICWGGMVGREATVDLRTCTVSSEST